MWKSLDKLGAAWLRVQIAVSGLIGTRSSECYDARVCLRGTQAFSNCS